VPEVHATLDPGSWLQEKLLSAQIGGSVRGAEIEH
jgi:hypothetical protein